MSDTHKKTHQEQGDELLKRMLKTPPKPKRSDSKPKSHDDNAKKPKN